MIDTVQQRQTASGKLFKNIPFFSELSSEESETVEKLFVKRQYAKEQIVLLEEENCSCMYLIYSGKVRVVKQNEEGREQIITIHKKNDFFGEMSLLDGKTSPATIIAHEDAVIGFLSKVNFDRYLLNNEAIRTKIINLLCARLRESWDMIKILSFNNENAEHRVLSILDRLQDLYGVSDARGVIINVKLTHQQIASYASVTRETVSRVLKNLAKTEMIEILENKSILLTQAYYRQKGKQAPETGGCVTKTPKPKTAMGHSVSSGRQKVLD
jgi:CRP-like cAMP-binding protein